MTENPSELTEAQARAFMRQLGRVEGELAASFAIPLYWITREEDGRHTARNGTAFVLDTGERVFGVTANHVLEGWRTDWETKDVISLQLGDLSLDPVVRHAIIAAHAGIDLATFQIKPDELAQVAPGKIVLRGYQGEWPPTAPQKDRGIFYAGYPGREKIWLSPKDISFGAAYGGGVASSISESDVSSLIARNYMMPVEGGPALPPENYNFQGISGGPMLTVIGHRGLRTHALAGVIYQGPNTSLDPKEAIAGLEIIKARRAHFILADGTLDVARWGSLQAFR